MLPRRVCAALACAGATGTLVLAGIATLPAAAGASAAAVRAPQDDPSPSAGTDAGSSGIVVLPSTQAPPTTKAPLPTSAAPATHSAARTSAAPTSRGTTHGSSSAGATKGAAATRTYATTSTSGSSTGSRTTSTGSSSGSGGSGVTYYNGPVDLPTDLAASQGPVLVTSKAAGGKRVLVPVAQASPNRKVGSFSLSSVLVTTVVAAAIVALLGGVGLGVTRRFGTRLSEPGSAHPHA